MTKNLVFVFALWLVSFPVIAQPNVHTSHVNPGLRFTENLGQWDHNILFRAQFDGGSLFMEQGSVLFNFYDKQKYRALHHGGITKSRCPDAVIPFHSYRIRFEGCNNVSIETQEQGEDYENYFLGNNKNKWKGGVKNFHRVWYKNLYQNIDYEVISATNGFKYNFHIKPGGNTALIKLKYEGLDNMKLVDGALVYSLTINKIVEKKPFAYQVINGTLHEIKCNYVLKNNQLSFEFPEAYNKRYTLVIDPLLVFAAQSGSTADNFGMTATYDAAGNFYAGGTCFNVGYPTTIGAYSLNFSGNATPGLTDVVITKYNTTGTALLFSTYLGGTETEIVSSLIVDHSDNLCLFGATGSSDFPISGGAYDASFNNGQPLSFLFNGTTFTVGTDIYISKFNSSGTSLLASTYLGGNKNDGVNHVNNQTPLPPPNPPLYEYVKDSLQYNYGDQYRGEIQIDAANNIYIASSTRSSNFPTTANALDNTLGGQQDAIIAKFNSTLSQLLYSTYLGGNYNDCANSLILTANEEVYVCGGTSSADFPTTNGAYSTLYNGGKTDGFISRINTLNGTLMQSTFIGTWNYDQCYFIQSDTISSIYVYGQSLGNMPVLNSVYYNPGTHQFISRLDSALANLELSTVIGSKTNNVDISPSAFRVDACGNIYLSGWGGDIITLNNPLSNMPLMNPTQSTTDGNDFYLMVLSANAGSLLYGSYFGGAISDEHVDGGTSRINRQGVFYQSVCAGCGGNDDFPVTPGAWPNTLGNPNHAQNCNNGVFKIDTQIPLAASNISFTTTGCLPVTVSLTNVTPGTFYNWYLENGVTNSTTVNPTITYSNTGTYTVSLNVYNLSACNQRDSSAIIINVNPVTPTITIISSNSFICLGQSATLTANGANTFTWNTGAFSNSTTITPSVTSSYTVMGTNISNCNASVGFTQNVSVCEGIPEDFELENKILIYPNPTNGQFYLVGNGAPEMTSVQLMDLNGRLIQQLKYNPVNNSIHIVDQPKGMYFLKVYKNDILFSIQKLVLN